MSSKDHFSRTLRLPASSYIFSKHTQKITEFSHLAAMSFTPPRYISRSKFKCERPAGEEPSTRTPFTSR